MSRPINITWNSAAVGAICAAQTTAGAGNLLINGTLAQYTSPDSPNTFVRFPGCYRTVSLTSAADLSAITFTITGTYGGLPQVEARVGPNANTVYTTLLFDTVTSVSAGAAVGTNVQVGSGTTGQTKWVSYDTYRMMSDFSVSAIVTGTINYSLILTLDDVQSKLANNLTINTFSPVASLTATNSSQFANFSYTCTYIAIKINSATVAAGSLDVIFQQQGDS